MAKKALRKHNQGEDEVHLIHYCAMKFAVILTVNLNKNKKTVHWSTYLFILYGKK